MKKILQVFSLTAAIALVYAAAIVNLANAQTLVETEAATGIGTTLDTQAAPNSRSIINTVKNRLRASNTETQVQRQKIENRVGNGVEEQNALKTKLLEQRASTTQFRKEVKEERKEIRKKSRLDAFKIRQTAMVRQLSLSISNLEQIAGRVADRISKAETSGRDMTQAKNLLTVAREKIAEAKIAVQSVKDYVPPTVTATTTSDAFVSVDLVKPREVGAEAIKAVKEAKESLVAVVRAIAHAMGLGNTAGTNATSSASTTAQ